MNSAPPCRLRLARFEDLCRMRWYLNLLGSGFGRGDSLLLLVGLAPFPLR